MYKVFFEYKLGHAHSGPRDKIGNVKNNKKKCLKNGKLYFVKWSRFGHKLDTQFKIGWAILLSISNNCLDLRMTIYFVKEEYAIATYRSIAWLPFSFQNNIMYLTYDLASLVFIFLIQNK